MGGLPDPGAVSHARGVHHRRSARRRRNAARRGSGPASVAVASALALVAGTALAAAPEANADVDAEADTEASADANADANAEPSTDATVDADADASTDVDADTTTDADATVDADATATTTADAEQVRPPRIDGTYLGFTVFGGLAFARVNTFDTDGPFAAFGGTAGVGQMVFPWLGLGLHGGGGGGVRSEQGARQTMGQGYLGIEFKFVPLPKRLPLSLMAAFGFGGGAIRQEGIASRAGYGGAQFGAAVRYELFPFAKRFRPYRGGGFGLGPQLGWLGFTPAAADRPMSHTLYLALAATFYFGS